MVLLLYLWENLKKWSSKEEMRGANQYGGGGYGANKQYGGGGVAVCPSDDQEFHQLGGLRRMDSAASIRAHFYPEGGWGWIVCACAFLAHVTTSGAQLSAGALHIVLSNKFQESNAHHWLGPLSWSVSSIFAPLVVNLCRRKNARVLSLIGGIMFPLSLLFTSFATELHQIFFSFGLIGGIGSCLVRESSGVVLGEYFRRRRHFVEQVVLAGTGVGVTLFSLLYLSLTRHIEWAQGFRIGAGLSTICALLPAFYRTAAMYHPNRTAIEQLKTQQQLHKGVSSGSGSSGGGGGVATSFLLPLGGDIFHSLQLFCVPALKPLLWSASISSFGLYAPVFLMSDFGRKEGLSGGSLLLLQTHLGLGLSLGVILGAILTLKKFRCCNITPRMLCSVTCFLTGISMIAISSVKGYYGYSLSAWLYGIALGSYLYSIKVLTMDLTRTKYWSRIWSCIQSLMGPGILIGTGATSYLGKPGFYACATCVLVGAGLIGFQLIDLSKCGSPPLSSLEDNESPIPPVPPPITLDKYGVSSLPGSHPGPLMGVVGSGSTGNIRDSPGGSSVAAGFYPLRKSISQPFFYPCCPEESSTTIGYSPHCPECNPLFYPPMVRSFSLPQALPQLKSTGTQTNPNSPEKHPLGNRHQQHLQQQHLAHAQQQPIFPPTTTTSFDRSSASTTPAPFQHSQVYPEQMTRLPKHSVMFASNPQLYPQSSFSSQTDSSRPPSSAANFYGQNQTSHSHHLHHHLRHHQLLQQQPRQASRSSQYPQLRTSSQLSEERQQKQTHQQQLQYQYQQHKQHSQSQSSENYFLRNQFSVPVHQHQPPAGADVIQKPERPAFTRHYFDSSKIMAQRKTQVQFKKPEADQISQQQQQQQQQQQPKTRLTQQQPQIHQYQSSQQQKQQSQQPYQKPYPPQKAQQPPQKQYAQPSHYQQPQQYQQQQQQAKKPMKYPPLQKQPNVMNEQSIDLVLRGPPSVTYFQEQALHELGSKDGRKKGHELKQQQQQQQQQLPKQQNQLHHQSQSQQQSSQSQPRKFSQFTPTPMPAFLQNQQKYQKPSAPTAAPTPSSQTYSQQSSSQHHHHQHHHPQLQHPRPLPFRQSSDQPTIYHAQAPAADPMATYTNTGQPFYPTQNYYYYGGTPGSSRQYKISSSEFDVEEPKFNSLRRPTSSMSNSTAGGGGGGAIMAGIPPVAGGRAPSPPCPYCDPDGTCPPLSLSVPIIQPSNPHLMCHYGITQGHPMLLRRRNTWHYHKDYLEAITTSV